MTGVISLGYIGCSVRDLEQWNQMLRHVFGLQHRSDHGEHALTYRLDEHHHRLALYQENVDRLEYLGWEVRTQEDLEALEKKLVQSGIDVERGDLELRKERAVQGLIVFEGPDRVRTEIFFGAVMDPAPAVSLTGNSGFNTGMLGMGHVVLASEKPVDTVKWYQSVLGFRLTDRIVWNGMEAAFLRCNPRHHSLAITNAALGMKGGDMSHFMLEANALDDVGLAYDVVQEKDYALGLTLGRHSNDRTISFYFYTPSGWLIEYGYGGMTIDDATWSPKYYECTKIWGQKFLPPPAGKRQRV